MLIIEQLILCSRESGRILLGMRALLVLVLSSACGFDGSTGAKGGEEPPAPDAGPDAPACSQVTGFVSFCAPEPTASLTFAAGEQLNTGEDPRCQVITPQSGPPICLLYATEIEIPSGVSVTAFGSRPLALVAKSSIKIGGILDVSSKSTRPTRPGAGSHPSGLCSFTSDAESSTGGGGGGAGGTLATAGGSGGAGDDNGNGDPAGPTDGGVPGMPLAELGFLRGGCNGQRGGTGETDGDGIAGAGGQGGGAVYLRGGTIEVSGAILAGGSGADATRGQGGGGGGGSGGVIVLHTPALTVTGMLLATGAGGSAGAGLNQDVGEAGSDATTTSPATGGSTGAGLGGSGAANTVATAGLGHSWGAGGGGGGNGFIVVIEASFTPTLMTVPAPIQLPLSVPGSR